MKPSRATRMVPLTLWGDSFLLKKTIRQFTARKNSRATVRTTVALTSPELIPIRAKILSRKPSTMSPRSFRAGCGSSPVKIVAEAGNVNRGYFSVMTQTPSHRSGGRSISARHFLA